MELITILQQTPLLLALYLLVIGLVVGSFLNVAIYRLPVMMRREWEHDCQDFLSGEDAQTPSLKPETETETEKTSFNLATPNSHCPHCDHAIKVWENIPVVSYLLLRGKCSNCSSPISLRYPIIELTAALLAVSCGLMLGASFQLIGALLLTWTLLTLSMIDVDHQLLPDNLTLPLLWIGLACNYFGTFVSLEDAVIGAMAGYLSLWTVYWLFKLATGREGMGYGDFKLLAALGAWLGWQVLPMILLLSSLVGAVTGICMIVFRGRDRTIPIPFGPYLAAAGWLSLLWGQDILDIYMKFSGLSQAG